MTFICSMTINVYVTSSIVEHAIQSNLDLCSYALREGNYEGYIYM
jgi:hypothetical protein